VKALLDIVPEVVFPAVLIMMAMLALIYLFASVQDLKGQVQALQTAVAIATGTPSP
jgi:hypothetical protein